MMWFEKLAPRERVLIAIAAGLFAVFAIWQFLVSPILSGTSAAERQLNAAKRDHTIVSNGLPKMTAQNNINKAKLNQSGIIETARKTNVAISRVQPESDGKLQVWLEDSPAQNVYSFLSELDRGYSAVTIKAQMTRREGGTIAAQFTFAPL